MVKLTSQAEELNNTIKTQNPAVYEMLSRKGKAIYFPALGILAQGQDAKGKKIDATLGTAYEDDGSPMVLPSIAENINIDPREAFPYAPSPGIPKLREKWKEMLISKNPSLMGIETSTPVVTCALTHGLNMIAYLFMDEGDEIIIANLNWENYDLVFINAYGATYKYYNFFKNNAFDTEDFKKTLSEGKTGKKIALLNFPNNPSGYSPTKEAARAIIQALADAADAGNKLLVILDDAYFGLVFDQGIYEESLFGALAGLHENLLAVKVDGITKEEYAWGFRVGFLTYGIKNGSKELYKALEAKTAGAVRGSISNTSHLAQSLVLKALQSPTYREEKTRNAQKIKERFLVTKEILAAHPEYQRFFEPLPFNSGYFMCLRLKKPDAETVRKTLLTDKYSTGVISIGTDLLRVAFAATAAGKLEKLFNNIYESCREVSATPA